MAYYVHIEYIDGALGGRLGDMFTTKAKAVKVARLLAKTPGDGAKSVVVLDSEKQTVAEFKVKNSCSAAHKTISKERQEFGDMISRAIAPQAWAEYDAGGGHCSNAAGFDCVESIKAAARVINALEKSGFPVPSK